MKSILMFLMLILFLAAASVSAHCDGEDGPVVSSAKKALDEKNINLVLIWVQEKDEQIIKEAFEKTLSVRKLDPSARDLADKYFFETIVRVHRMGEGASFTGIKPAGFNNDPSVLAADKSVEKGSIQELYKMISEEIHNGLHHAYEQVEALKNYDKNDVEAGRRYISAYVNFLHYTEGLHKAAGQSGEKHEHTENHEG